MTINPMNNPMYDNRRSSTYFAKKSEITFEHKMEVGFVIATIILLTMGVSIFIATGSVIVDGWELNSFSNREYSNAYLSFLGSMCPLSLSAVYVFFRHKKIGFGSSLLAMVLPFTIVFVVTWICTVFVSVIGIIGQ